MAQLRKSSVSPIKMQTFIIKNEKNKQKHISLMDAEASTAQKSKE